MYLNTQKISTYLNIILILKKKNLTSMTTEVFIIYKILFNIS